MNSKILKFIISLLIMVMIMGLSSVYAEDNISIEYLVSNVDKYMTINTQKYGIFVNDKPIGYLSTEEEARNILSKLKTMYLEEGNDVLEVKFKEDVVILKDAVRVVDEDLIYSEEEALDYIIRGTNERKIHKVEKGDNFWDLALKYDILLDDLIAANPNVNPDKIQIGQEISLIVPKTLISVITIEEATYSEKIQYKVVYEDSSAYYKGDYRTKTSGIYGELEIVADVYKENGIEAKREVLSETIVKKPRTKVVYRGTKDPPPRIGTGTFDYPFDTSRGRVTSGFGMRYHPIYKDYRRHTGIDVGMSSGSPIYASDGGKVVYVGYNGGYGMMIKIDHGENIETIYAHLSKYYVKVGDKVFKGEKIGLSGNTGTSTGPHLHFEVRKLGTPIDPKKYLSFVF